MSSLSDFIGGGKPLIGSVIPLEVGQVNPVIDNAEYIRSGNVKDDIENYPDVPYSLLQNHGEYTSLILEAGVTGAKFYDDGATLFTSSSSADLVTKYTLSTPYDISTAVFSQSGTFGTSLRGFTFNLDGTKIYIANGSAANKMYSYTLSTPYDLTTATDDNLGAFSNEYYTASIDITDDGLKVFLNYNGILKQYSLSTPWDLSTISAREETLTLEGSGSYGGSFSEDGRFYAYSRSDYKAVYEFHAPFDISSVKRDLTDYWATSVTIRATSMSPNSQYVMYFHYNTAILYCFKNIKGVGIPAYASHTETHTPYYMRIK